MGAVVAAACRQSAEWPAYILNRDEGCGTADFQNPVTRGYDAMEDDFAT